MKLRLLWIAVGAFVILAAAGVFLRPAGSFAGEEAAPTAGGAATEERSGQRPNLEEGSGQRPNLREEPQVPQVTVSVSAATGGAPATAAAKPEPADNSYCYACHVNYQEEKLTSVHQPVGVGCETCHGMSIEHSGDEDNIIPPDRMFPKADIDPYCITCHEKEKLLKREEHRIYFADPLPDETCNNCHAEHHRLKVRTRVWDKKTRALLDDDGVRMMQSKGE